MMSRARNARLRLTLALLASRASSRLSSTDNFNSATGRPGLRMDSLDHTPSRFSRYFVSGGLAPHVLSPHVLFVGASPARAYHRRDGTERPERRRPRPLAVVPLPR